MIKNVCKGHGLRVQFKSTVPTCGGDGDRLAPGSGLSEENFFGVSCGRGELGVVVFLPARGRSHLDESTKKLKLQRRELSSLS